MKLSNILAELLQTQPTIEKIFGSRQMRHRLIQVILIQIIAAFVLVLAPMLSSAAPKPPYFLWFSFDRAPESVQFAECRSLQCDTPKLLAQHETCTVPGCLKSLPEHSFQCAETACLYQEPLISPGRRNPILQLIAQFPNETVARSSPPFTTDFRSGIAGYRDRHFNITLEDQSLQVEPDDKMKPSRWELFGTALTITQISELAIALLFLVVMRFNRAEVITVLLWIGFVNLLTFPVIWFFFPSLQPFQYQTARVFGVFSLLNAVAFSYVLIKRKITIASIIRTAIVWFFCLPIVLIVAFIVALFFGYAEFLPSAAGILSLITLVMSELCVLVWKSWLLLRSQFGFSNRQAYLLSLCMNLFSLGLSTMLLPALQRYG